MIVNVKKSISNFDFTCEVYISLHVNNKSESIFMCVDSGFNDISSSDFASKDVEVKSKDDIEKLVVSLVSPYGYSTCSKFSAFLEKQLAEN